MVQASTLGLDFYILLGFHALEIDRDIGSALNVSKSIIRIFCLCLNICELSLQLKAFESCQKLAARNRDVNNM